MRGVLLHHLQRSALSNLLIDNDVKEEDNDDDLFFGVISSHRYLVRPPVVKTGHWSLGVTLPRPIKLNLLLRTFTNHIKPSLVAPNLPNFSGRFELKRTGR
ncbi:hypothetical protein JG687_00000607 [Phytophthora cactorum]|uniref:Uncharacterized protein n=1 Tax=Phytophthora cactorum TaxID=29920 RepID=A0A8T1V098_9STRA|nr:hypothetical protein JG687_00000607 [Phytophthora cactorum]